MGNHHKMSAFTALGKGENGFQHRSARTDEPPELGLVRRMLLDGVQDALTGGRYTGETPSKSTRQRRAIEWIFANDPEWPFSFVNLCGVLGYSPEPFRRFLRVNILQTERRCSEMPRLTSSGPQGEVTLRVLEKSPSEYSREELREIVEKMRGVRGALVEKRAAKPRGSAGAAPKSAPIFNPDESI